jgi:hypothetical protein
MHDTQISGAHYHLIVLLLWFLLFIVEKDTPSLTFVMQRVLIWFYSWRFTHEREYQIGTMYALDYIGRATWQCLSALIPFFFVASHVTALLRFVNTETWAW